MAFQFLCPQGHLLQGDESQAGQQCKCPYCESIFVVPQPLGAGGQAPQPEPEPTPPPGLFDGGAPAAGPPSSGGRGGAPDFSWTQQQPQPQPQGQGAGFAGIQAAPDFTGAGGVQAPVGGVPGEGGGPPIVHIICPSGHQLETPREMLGQDALCPYCQVQFRLRYEDSIEYQREKEAERERREMKAGKAWMQWSIAAAVIVLIGLILMMVLSANH